MFMKMWSGEICSYFIIFELGLQMWDILRDNIYRELKVNSCGSKDIFL